MIPWPCHGDVSPHPSSHGLDDGTQSGDTAPYEWTSVDRDAILSSPEQRVKEGECPIFLLHSELNGQQPDPVEMSEELFTAWSPS